MITKLYSSKQLSVVISEWYLLVVCVCVELLLDQLIALRLLAPEQRVKVFDILLSRHRHQHEKKETRSGLPIIRSLADMGRRSSERRMVDTGSEIVHQFRLNFTQVFN